MSRNDNNVIMEGVQLRYLNFAGRPDKFNPNGGVRGFSVLLEDDVAEAMARDGWNVKFLSPHEDDGEDFPQQPYLKVAVRFDKYPPQIFVITSNNRTQIYEDDVAMLDTADMENVDLSVTPSNYKDRDGNSAIKCYLKALYVTLEENYLAQKYAKMDAIRANHRQEPDD